MFSRKVTVRINSFFEISNHKGRDLLIKLCGRTKGNPLLELVAHLQVLIKIIISQLSMKPIQFTVDQATFSRSGIVARRSTKSQRISRSHLQSRVKRITERSVENAEHIDIYFDKAKRKSYFKSVIDHYFVPKYHQKQFLHENQPKITLVHPMITRDCKSSESSRAKQTQNISISRLKLKTKLSLMDFSIHEMSSLPVIVEGFNGQKRPLGVHQPSSLISIQKINLIEKEKDMQESLFFESNASLLENSRVDSIESFKYVSIRKGGKLLGRSKVYNSQDNQHLHRQSSAKKIGMQVLWTPSASNSLEFPNYKTLKQLCYSIVQDRNGQQPLSLIYPTAYYSTLFVNQCEQLIDIVVSLVKTVSKGKGMVANNQIHIKNVVKKGQKQFVLTDWGCAAIREGFTVQGHTFNKDLGALCREGNKWIVTPQYLAPQLLKASQTGFYDHLWRQKGGVGSCDIWSIGCLIFELITLVPINSLYYCTVKGRDRKRGTLGVKVKSADRILAKLRGFKNYVVRSIKQEMRMRKDLKINDKILELLPKMLEQSAENRLSADEILMKLT